MAYSLPVTVPGVPGRGIFHAPFKEKLQAIWKWCAASAVKSRRGGAWPDETLPDETEH
jgi:hypothetical protein